MPQHVERQVERIRQALSAVIDPEVGLDIISLGLVYEILPRDGAVVVRMTMTSRGCPMAGVITASAHSVLASLPGVEEVTIDLVWEPVWTPERIDPRGREQLGI